MAKKDDTISRLREEITASISQTLLAAGWKQGRYSYEWAHPGGDYMVDLSGDYGYSWELLKFSDADIDGVATPRWVSARAEGDTVEELRAVLAQRGMWI